MNNINNVPYQKIKGLVVAYHEKESTLSPEEKHAFINYFCKTINDLVAFKAIYDSLYHGESSQIIAEELDFRFNKIEISQIVSEEKAKLTSLYSKISQQENENKNFETIRQQHKSRPPEETIIKTGFHKTGTISLVDPAEIEREKTKMRTIQTVQTSQEQYEDYLLKRYNEKIKRRLEQQNSHFHEYY